MKVLTELSAMINTSLSYLSQSNCRNMPTPTRLSTHIFSNKTIARQDYKTTINYKKTTKKDKPAKDGKQYKA